jgi:hypothetical protein
MKGRKDPSWQKLRKTHRYTIAMVYFTSDFFYFFLINWFFLKKMFFYLKIIFLFSITIH